jgi:hypothetical protein
MNLIINADLSNPPSLKSSLRELTFFAHIYLKYDVILETNYNKDFYYKYLKGIALDFIEDITAVGEESGLRIEHEPTYAPSIIVDRITTETMTYLLRSIGYII